MQLDPLELLTIPRRKSSSISLRWLRISQSSLFNVYSIYAVYKTAEIELSFKVEEIQAILQVMEDGELYLKLSKSLD